jgi:hypothetical protein
VTSSRFHKIDIQPIIHLQDFTADSFGAMQAPALDRQMRLLTQHLNDDMVELRRSAVERHSLCHRT